MIGFYDYTVLATYAATALGVTGMFQAVEGRHLTAVFCLLEERQQTEGGGRKYYLGLPITASALVFPLFYLLGLLLPGGPYILAAGMLLLAALYVTPLRIPKPGLAAICLLSAVGALELAGLILAALGRL